MTTQSEQIGELLAALAKAQGEISGATKDSANPFYKSSYADLASVWEACRAPLSRHGLAVIQTIDIVGEKSVLTTILGHSSGQWIKGIIPLPSLAKPQEMGSAITYYRRYSLAAMVGIYQEDDDAEKAQQRRAPEQTKSAEPMPKKTVARFKELYAQVDDPFAKHIMGMMWDKMNASSVEELSEAEARPLIEAMEKRIAKIKEKANGQAGVA